MPLQLKTDTGRTRFLEAAARQLALDEPFVTKSAEQVDAEVATTLARPLLTTPFHTVGLPLSSVAQRAFLKDARAQIAAMVGESDSLEQEIRQSSKSAFALLDDLQREVMALDAVIAEDEVRGYSGFNNVHHNTWVRTQDQPLDYAEDGWLQDFKTGLTFLPENMAEVVPGMGLTLPVLTDTPLLIGRASLVGEVSDVGDSSDLVVAGDPMDLVRPNKVFRHVIVRLEHDETTRAYQHLPSYVTVLLELPTVQLVNYLNVRPLGHSPVQVDRITYVNADGNDVNIVADEFQTPAFRSFVFEPVRTRAFKVRFVQSAPVTKGEIDVVDTRAQKINELLAGAGFSQLLEAPSESLEGRVYDFSMEEIEIGLRTYISQGIYRSQEIRTSRPRGIELTHTSTAVEVATATLGDADQPMPYGSVFPEFYLGVRLQLDGVTRVNSLVPVPDDRGEIAEALPIVGAWARLRFFPDLVWDTTPLTVYRNNTALAIGTDYQISLDAGSTWLSAWPDSTTFDEAKQQAVAGRARIKFLEPDYRAFYWLEYKPYAAQSLVSNGDIRLLNSRVVVAPELFEALGTLQTVIVLRATSNNSYVTPVVESYFLKVREDVA